MGQNGRKWIRKGLGRASLRKSILPYFVVFFPHYGNFSFFFHPVRPPARTQFQLGTSIGKRGLGGQATFFQPAPIFQPLNMTSGGGGGSVLVGDLSPCRRIPRFEGQCSGNPISQVPTKGTPLLQGSEAFPASDRRFLIPVQMPEGG